MSATGETEIRRLMRELDWSQTSLGALEQWPQSLKTAFGMCLASRFPFIIWWGDDLTVVYNDAYIPIFMNKHPGAFGSPGLSLRAWGEPVTRAAIEPMLRGVMAGAEATWSEDQLLILERSGFREETYFTWSYSPIPAEGGRVGGVLTTVTEVTQKVLSERRLRVLRELSAHAAEAKTTDQACREAIQVLRGDPHDLPFALLYVLEGTIEGDEATLHGAVGIPLDHPAAPAQISLGDGSRWPLHRAQQVAVEVDLAESSLLGAVPADPWPEPARRAVVLPLLCAGEARPYGFLVAGTSPRLAVGPPYHDFLQLVAGHIATAIANAKTSQAERQRAEKLAELDRAKTTFFSNVSHEFRTPLTLMLGPLEDVLPHIAEPQRGELERVHRNGKRLLKLVNTLLDFSRVEAGRVEAGYEPVDLAVLTADLASSFRSLTERAGLRLVVECATLPEPIWVDPEMWEKIVLNLMSNAFKFTFQGEIGVRLAWQDGAAQLRISDTGAGIPSAALPRLFERFHRVEGARGRSFEGSGIGLALVQELVNSHGGSVEVASDEGRGTTFTVTIPSGTEHLPPDRLCASRASSDGRSRSAVLEELSGLLQDDDASRGTTRATGAVAEISAPTRPRVLLADDNADMRDYVRRLLEPAYDVIAVGNGELALAAVRDRLPDLVLTDVMMPILDGFGLLRALRAEPTTQTLPVIMLSARAGEEARVEGLAAGADDYLVKPFSARELLARVAARLEIAQLHARLSAELEDRVDERTAQLLAANQELESFSYSVSHDLRAPLRHILGFAQLLDERLVSVDLDMRGREHLRKITVAAKRGGQLVDDLLAFSRLGRAELRKQRVSLDFLVAEARAELAPEAGGRQICWTVHALPEVEGDPSLLRLVFKNLVGNAIKYTREAAQPAIEIGALENRGEIECWIKDNGIGFDMAYVDKLFGVFQRLHHERDYEGTGIGLAHVRRIITRHGGRTWAQGEVGRGATFSFALPSRPPHRQPALVAG